MAEGEIKLHNVQIVKIGDIKRNPNNPRIIKDDKFRKLVESIKTFPEMLALRPIIVNDDMEVLGGNMRLKACNEAGMKKVPIIKASDLTKEQQKEFIIKDNVGFGEWDWDILADDWDKDKLEDWAMDIPDFDFNESVKNREKPNAVKSNILITVPIENKEGFLKEVQPLIEKWGAVLLENDSSTY